MTEKRIGDIIFDALKRGNGTFGSRHTGIIDWDKIWTEVCGEAKEFSYVKRMEKDILYVCVKNSAWLLELRKNKTDLIKLLTEKTGKTLKDIKFYR